MTDSHGLGVEPVIGTWCATRGRWSRSGQVRRRPAMNFWNTKNSTTTTAMMSSHFMAGPSLVGL
jgi:hypothetical protein